MVGASHQTFCASQRAPCITPLAHHIWYITPTTYHGRCNASAHCIGTGHNGRCIKQLEHHDWRIAANMTTCGTNQNCCSRSFQIIWIILYSAYPIHFRMGVAQSSGLEGYFLAWSFSIPNPASVQEFG